MHRNPTCMYKCGRAPFTTKSAKEIAIHQTHQIQMQQLQKSEKEHGLDFAETTKWENFLPK